MTAKLIEARRSILKSEDRPGSKSGKKVFFDEISIQEYPIILGDNPAVSSGAPITIDWESSAASTVDLDFFEYCRTPLRKSRKKLILSVRRRAGFLLASGYSLEDIANATLEAEETKKLRAESLRSAGWANPWEFLNGAVETTGTVLRRADILGVGAVVGAGFMGVNAVVGAGADVTVKTGKMIVGGATRSTRAVVDGARTSTRVVTDAGNKLVVKPVGKVVSSTGKAVSNGVSQTGWAIGTGITTTGRAVGTGITTTGRAVGTGISSTGRAVGGAVGTVVNSTGRAFSYVVNPSGGASEAKSRELSPKRSTAGGIKDLTAIDVQ